MDDLDYTVPGVKGRPRVQQGLDFGIVVGSRLVDESWQYESLVQWAGCFCNNGEREWVPTIELSFIG